MLHGATLNPVLYVVHGATLNPEPETAILGNFLSDVTEMSLLYGDSNVATVGTAVQVVLFAFKVPT